MAVHRFCNGFECNSSRSLLLACGTVDPFAAGALLKGFIFTTKIRYFFPLSLVLAEEMGDREGLEGDAGGHGASVRWEDFVVSDERLLAVIWLSVEQPSCVISVNQTKE